MLIIRRAQQQDAASLVEAMVDAERSGFMLANPDERRLTVPQATAWIARLEQAEHQVMFVATQQSTIIGYLLVQQETMERTKHRASIVIGVHSEHRGKGVGTALFESAFTWAYAKQIRRLELTVIAHNDGAKHLYKKMGFTEEGVKRDSLLIDGQFVNEYYMSRLL